MTFALAARAGLVSAVFAVAGCDHASAEAASNPSPDGSAEQKLTLQGLPVKITLPNEFHRTKDSDESIGTVAFEREGDRPLVRSPEQIVSVALIGTKGVTMPSSLDAAVAKTRVEFCQGDPTKCTVLGREALPGGGYLVTVKDVRAVTVEVMRPAPQGRAFMCEAYAANMLADGTAKTWLDDSAQVQRAQSMVEAICRTAHAG